MPGTGFDFRQVNRGQCLSQVTPSAHLFRIRDQPGDGRGGGTRPTRSYYCCCCSCSCWAWKFSDGDGGGLRRTIVAGAMSSLAGASARATVTETLSSLSAPPLNTPRLGGTSA